MLSSPVYLRIHYMVGGAFFHFQPKLHCFMLLTSSTGDPYGEDRKGDSIGIAVGDHVLHEGHV